MQIRNDYTSFQNRNYQEGHTHHITECLHDDQIKKKEGAAGPSRSTPVTQSNHVEFSKDGDTYQMAGTFVPVKKDKGKSGIGLIKGFWDALGEEGKGEGKNVMAAVKADVLSGIHGAAAAIKDGFQYQIVGRLRSIPAKVKTVVQSAKTRFGRRGDAFAALTDGQTQRRGSSHTEKQGKDGQVTSAKKDEDIPMKALKHSHLMDSYSRKGEYCQLNDNLTYRNVKRQKRISEEP